MIGVSKHSRLRMPFAWSNCASTSTCCGLQPKLGIARPYASSSRSTDSIDLLPLNLDPRRAPKVALSSPGSILESNIPI